MVAKKKSQDNQLFLILQAVSCNENCLTAARDTNPQWRADMNHIFEQRETGQNFPTCTATNLPTVEESIGNSEHDETRIR